jgi:hypothetical protein
VSGLQQSGDPPVTLCRYCSANAVGPCASCGAPVCGDCCTLTEGGAKVWAICLECDRRGGRSLASAWRRFLMWTVIVLAGLAAVTALLGWLTGQH